MHDMSESSFYFQTMFSSSHETVCEHIAKRIKVPTRFASGKLKEPLHYTLTRINDGITRALFSLSPVLIPVRFITHHTQSSVIYLGVYKCVYSVDTNLNLCNFLHHI